MLDKTITVTGTRLSRTTTQFPFEKDRFAEVLHKGGFGLISKGVFLAQDIVSDGFKRGDVAIVIDGERFHAACPNRMDSPITRTNSLEMESIDLNKTSSAPQSDIGGSISYNREQPVDPTIVRAGLTQSMAASEASDFGFIFNANNHRLAGRFATGKGYEDADGKSFVDRYGYKDNTSYKLYEGSITGLHRDLLYRAEVTYTEDIMFPYLMMDERTNSFVSTSLEYKRNKLYLNYTDHLMDDGLRYSMMAMETDATNLTLGLTGSFYELYYRNWDADNKIVTSMMTLNNHLIPDVDLLSGIVHKTLKADYYSFWGRFGFAYHKMHDADQVAFYRPLYDKTSDSRSFALVDIGASRFYGLFDQFTGSVAVDLSRQAPSAEQLFIAMKRPMTNPWWSGNPTLDGPVRTSIRADIHYNRVILEAYATHVWDYVNLTAQAVDGRNYLTYKNVDVNMYGFNLMADWRYFDLTARYTWAKNITDNSPLVEITPFSVISNLKSPVYKNISGNLRLTYNDAQTRVDKILNESPTSSWFQLDLGLKYSMQAIDFSLTVQNLTDELYYQHLSYMRNPYASGYNVYEPGLTVMLNILYNTDFK